MRGVEEKQPTDTKTKGVVGHIGKKRPINAINKNTKPRKVRIIIFNFNLSPHFK